ncbi:TolC family outer membrane protein [Candidatus Magnetaquicoccus inordinatus]|uniref:TolC family outer membrane protein n=1 Tax=Candidatus Magnetaquicoccus inordinatus TaxID=2496818 RepID=UPI00102B8621|nr:TolC family outer membrane protein [Candidatus Magnetaquicoccus inordinatus]
MKTSIKRHTLKIATPLLAIACFCTLGAAESWSEEGAVSSLLMRDEGELLRLQIESRVGVLAGATLTARGSEVTVELVDVDAKELASLVDSLQQRPALLRGVHVLPGRDNKVRLVLQLAAPVAIFDETVVAASQNRSRWELLLGPADSRAPDMALAPPALSAMELVSRGGRSDLILSGSSGLVAEVYFEENPPRLLIDLPGVPREQLLAVANSFAPENNLVVRNVRVAASGAAVQSSQEAPSLLTVEQPTTLRMLSRKRYPASGAMREQFILLVAAANPKRFPDPKAAFDAPLAKGEQLQLPAGLPTVAGAGRSSASGKGYQLLFELQESVDLIGSAGVMEGDRGRVLVGLAPDAPPQAAMMDKGNLTDLHVDELAGRLEIAIQGVAESRINAYTVDEPPQLIVDFLGWSPKQLAAAVAAFTPSHPAVRSMRVETTRLGSGRLVAELASPTTLISKSLTAQKSGEELQRTLILALRTPLSGDTTMAGGERETVRDVLDGRFRRTVREEGDQARPSLVIRPVQLEGRWAKEKPPVPSRGKSFGLLPMMQQALERDPKYLSAKSDYEANIEAVPQARAGYLPSASFDAQYNKTQQNVLKAANASFPTGASTYASNSQTLTITQPILKLQAYVKMDQAALAAEQARINLVAAEQDLLLRVATNYLNLLAAKDGRELAQAEREATEKQYEQAKQRLERGLGTITQLHDTEARFAVTEAHEIEAGNRYDDALQALKEIVGVRVEDVKGFRGDFDAPSPQPDRVDSWVQAALEQNLALQSRNLAWEIADLEVSRQQAGYLPTLNLVGTMARQDSGGSLYGDGQTNENKELGLRFNMPLFEGGMTRSLVREASARKDKAEQEREQELRHTERATRSAFLVVQASSRSLAALRKTVKAQDSALQARLEGFKLGTTSIVNVVDAYRLFFSAKRDYLQARYDYLVNRLRLKQAVGSLSRNDLEDLGALLRND